MQDFYQLADARILSMPGAGLEVAWLLALVAAGGQISSEIGFEPRFD